MHRSIIGLFICRLIAQMYEFDQVSLGLYVYTLMVEAYDIQ